MDFDALLKGLLTDEFAMPNGVFTIGAEQRATGLIWSTPACMRPTVSSKSMTQQLQAIPWAASSPNGDRGKCPAEPKRWETQ